ncbi:MAG: GIY-YIG nuclease family protein [Deltaproteobacteria bacterium]|nr:GIY-YIG nuclease family protein [Deltaproteobacteria bacterium]
MVLARDGSVYTGISPDPERRVCEHNGGLRGAKALRGKRPVRLLGAWRCADRSEALSLEARVKRLGAAEKWSLLLGNPSDALPAR